MVSIVEGFLLAGVLAGVGLCWFGYRVFRLPRQLGRRSFLGFVAIVAVGCLVPGAVGFIVSFLTLDTQQATWLDWTQLPFLFWLLSTLPWFIFALRYTGTRTALSRRNWLLISLPYGLFIAQVTVSTVFGLDTSSPLLNGVGSALFIYIISLAVAGSYLLLQNTYAYGHLSVGQGGSLVLAQVGSLVVWNLIGMPDLSTTTRAGAFATGGALMVVALGVALGRYGLFESTPSIGMLGDRALTRETDDLMFVVDSDGTLITINETAVEQLDTPRSKAVGQPFRDVLERSIGELRQVETVTVQTADGTRQYDPQISRVSDHRDDELGATISLRDVTDRELREQRLAVLNRVLRHNVRNEADVIKSHAGALDGGAGDHVAPIVDAADSIVTLGQQAQRIDQYVSGSTDDGPVDLLETVRTVLETVEADDAAVSVSVEAPSSATLTTNRQALRSALESALDNAVAYAESTVTVAVEDSPDGYAIRIADDGPGIPEWELESLGTGEESPLGHTTGLGLWQLKWAVRTLNGELSFDTTDGTTVEIVVPDRESSRVET
jgi:signal transduction histidine kinase